MDSCWVLKGNIVLSRPYGNEIRCGTKLFRPNAKVYLADIKHSWAVIKPDKIESIRVLGQHINSRKWIVSFVRSTYVQNWRLAVEHNPFIIKRLKYENWPGFGIHFDCEERDSQ